MFHAQAKVCCLQVNNFLRNSERHLEYLGSRRHQHVSASGGSRRPHHANRLGYETSHGPSPGLGAVGVTWLGGLTVAVNVCHQSQPVAHQFSSRRPYPPVAGSQGGGNWAGRQGCSINVVMASFQGHNWAVSVTTRRIGRSGEARALVGIAVW